MEWVFFDMALKCRKCFIFEFRNESTALKESCMLNTKCPWTIFRMVRLQSCYKTICIYVNVLPKCQVYIFSISINLCNIASWWLCWLKGILASFPQTIMCRRFACPFTEYTYSETGDSAHTLLTQWGWLCLFQILMVACYYLKESPLHFFHLPSNLSVC